MMQWLKKQWMVIKGDWLKLTWITLAGLAVIVIVAQLLFPGDKLVPFTALDGTDYGGQSKAHVAADLDAKYLGLSVPIYFGSSPDNPYISPTLANIGLTVSNATRVNDLDYPWYMRIIPTSIFWVHLLTGNPESPAYSHNSQTLDSYLQGVMGDGCVIKVQNAGLKVEAGKLVVTPSYPGGQCDIGELTDKLGTIAPVLSQDNRLRIELTDETKPVVNDSDATELKDSLISKFGDGLQLKSDKNTIFMSSGNLFGLLDFVVNNDKLTYALNNDKAKVYLDKTVAPKINKKAGTTTVTTYNFIEKSRVTGATGITLDVPATITSLRSYVDGDSQNIAAVTTKQSPKVVYEREYGPLDDELSNLMKQYDQTHAGIYGVSLVELDGKNRRAGYNDTTLFTTASTYKLFVAYSTLKRVEAGEFHWSDIINAGRNLTKCFDDMIVLSDNGCAEALLIKIGRQNVTDEAHSIGAVHTTFMRSDGIKTTPADLSLVLAQLQMGQILSQQSSRDTWIGAMKRNVYRLGIPTGISGAVVADKVGFLDSLLHDASIVYSPSGTYVLIIMTDGSSWGNIAELAGQIEALRAQ